MPRLILYTERFSSPLGPMLLLSDEQQALRMLDWEDCKERMERLLRRQYGEGRTQIEPATQRSESRDAVEAYFAGDMAKIETLKVKTSGTEFQRQVWAALRTIPAGRTDTYGQLATRIERPKAVRAVGLANGANPIAIVVPCHRVIGVNSALTGYGSGIEKKRWLLNHEAKFNP